MPAGSKYYNRSLFVEFINPFLPETEAQPFRAEETQEGESASQLFQFSADQFQFFQKELADAQTLHPQQRNVRVLRNEEQT